MSRLTLAFLIACIGVGPVSAQPNALDLIPEDAAVAIVVRSLDELRDKGEAFVKDHNMRLEKDQRPSSLFAFLFEALHIKKGVDGKGSAALMLPNLEKIGQKGDNLEALYHLVLKIPIANVEEMAGNFGYKTLQPGKIMAYNDRVVCVQGRHLLLSFRQKAIEVVLAGKPVTGELSPAQKTTLARSDLIVHFGARAWGKVWEEMVRSLGDRLTGLDDAQDKAAVEQFVAALDQVRFVVAGLRIQPGLDLDVVASFEKKAADGAVPFLTVLGGGAGVAELTGLPDQAPLFAYAAKGDGTRNMVIARTLLKIAFDQVPEVEKLLAAADRRKFLAAFQTMYQHLKGSRAAVYHSGDPAKYGRLAAIGVLDLDDPDAHLSRWADVIEVANNSAARTVPAGQAAPKFTYAPKAETLDGRRVDVLTLTVPNLGGDEKELQALLGPDWNRLRIVVLDRAAILLLGSDTELLKKALANRQDKARGLVDNPVVKAALAELAPERKLEFHINMAGAVALSKGAEHKAESLSSFAVIIEPDRLQLQIRIPAKECKSVLGVLNLSR